MMKPLSAAPRFLLYQREDGRTSLDVMLLCQTLWLTQKQLIEISGKSTRTLSQPPSGSSNVVSNYPYIARLLRRRVND
jgi:hypothetical protein